jgi:hypothetical protein
MGIRISGLKPRDDFAEALAFGGQGFAWHNWIGNWGFAIVKTSLSFDAK